MTTSAATADLNLDADYGSGATVYAALAVGTYDPNGNGGLGSFTEASYPGYAREPITGDSTHWPAAAAGSKSNNLLFVFPTNTGGSDYPVDWVLFLTSGGGSPRVIDALPLTSVVVPTGGTIAVPHNGAVIEYTL